MGCGGFRLCATWPATQEAITFNLSQLLAVYMSIGSSCMVRVITLPQLWMNFRSIISAAVPSS
jgi:hypothetical protein